MLLLQRQIDERFDMPSIMLVDLTWRATPITVSGSLTWLVRQSLLAADVLQDLLADRVLPGQKNFAAASSTMTTGCVPSRSLSVKSRPATIGMRKVVK